MLLLMLLLLFLLLSMVFDRAGWVHNDYFLDDHEFSAKSFWANENEVIDYAQCDEDFPHHHDHHYIERVKIK